jgi:hypothetical protein
MKGNPIRAVCSRYFVSFLIGTVVLSLFCGTVAAFSGGAFWHAILYAGAACLVIGIVASLIVSVSSVFSKGW